MSHMYKKNVLMINMISDIITPTKTLYAQDLYLSFICFPQNFQKEQIFKFIRSNQN
jgi:hypothetical protein